MVKKVQEWNAEFAGDRKKFQLTEQEIRSLEVRGLTAFCFSFRSFSLLLRSLLNRPILSEWIAETPLPGACNGPVKRRFLLSTFCEWLQLNLHVCYPDFPPEYAQCFSVFLAICKCCVLFGHVIRVMSQGPAYSSLAKFTSAEHACH